MTISLHFHILPGVYRCCGVESSDKQVIKRVYDENNKKGEMPIIEWKSSFDAWYDASHVDGLVTADYERLEPKVK